MYRSLGLKSTIFAQPASSKIDVACSGSRFFGLGESFEGSGEWDLIPTDPPKKVTIVTRAIKYPGLGVRSVEPCWRFLGINEYIDPPGQTTGNKYLTELTGSERKNDRLKSGGCMGGDMLILFGG